MADEQPEEEASQSARRRRGWLSRIFRSHDFARDLTVTTLGVLIALGIGEIVEEVRWKLRIAANDDAMRQEAGLLHSVYIERTMLQPCIARRISELGEVISAARASGRLPLIENIATPPNRADFGDSWELMIGTEIPLHIAPEELMGTATIWVNEDAYSDMVDRERDAFDRLSILQNRPGPIGESLLTEAEKQLTEAAMASDITFYIASQDSGVLAENKVTALYRPNVPLDRKILIDEMRRRYLCQPLRVDGQPYKLKGPVRQPRQSMMPSAS